MATRFLSLAEVLDLYGLNGQQLDAPIDDAERVILGVAAGTIGREEFAAWIRERLVPFRIG